MGSAAQPTLDTPRLVLRPFTPADAADVQRLAGAWEVAETTLLIPHPYPDGAAEQWIATHQPAWASGTALMCAITLRDTGALIGSISLTIDRDDASAEMGYWIGVSFWNLGYATEAARALLEFGFSALALTRIHAHHLARNPASGRVLEKAGMACDGLQPDAIRKFGRLEDVVFYSVTREGEASSRTAAE
jgi:RimJ/RimL family protein N-acetyltransferase